MRTAVACLLGGTVLFASTMAVAVHAVSVNQITDVYATAATGMFSFEPDYVEIAAGEGVTFLNSTGDHTVHAIPELWPDSVERIAISNRPEASFQFDKEGVYGVTCRRHGQYGMVLLVKVGDPDNVEGLKQKIVGMRGSKAKKGALTALVDKFLSD